MDVSDEMFAAVLLMFGMPPFKQSYDAHYDDYYGEEQFQYHDTEWQLKIVNYLDLDLDKRKWWLAHYVRWLMERERI